MTVETKLNFINGEWKASSGKTKESINPANTEEVVGILQNSTKEDLNIAIDAAKNSVKEWRKLSGIQRGEYLSKTAEVLEQRKEEIATTITKEMGKTLGEAKGEVGRAIAILKYYSNEGTQKVGEVIPSSDADAMLLTSRTPIGTVGIITPWNFPLAIPVWKIAPALIYGNTVVFKPATETGVTAALLVECFEEARLPAGVINFITGSGSVIGQGIAENSGINGVSFTGSNNVGMKIAEVVSSRNAKYQLEMGGNNPVIVLEDADLDLAAEQIINGAFLMTGQKCTATSRVIIENKVYDKLKEKLLNKVDNIKVGNGLNSDTWMGPLNNEIELNSVITNVKKVIKEGGKLLCGGNPISNGDYEKGFFFEPTIFENISEDMTIAKEEIFGPVVALMKVNSYEEAVDLANNTKYGLSASVFTKDITKMMTFIDEIDVGVVRVNSESAGVEFQAPFGGMKDSSSHSREQGKAAIEFYTSIKTILIKG